MSNDASRRKTFVFALLLPVLLLVAFWSLLTVSPARAQGPDEPAAVEQDGMTYTNPLTVTTSGGEVVETCADPAVIRGQTPGDNFWYMYCTTDPLNSTDKTGDNFNFHLIPIFRSMDLVNWEYVGDAFQERGPFGETEASPAGFWAPEISFFNNQYYLYFGVTNLDESVGDPDPNCTNDNGIWVATSSSPTGPWSPATAPVVAPRANGGGCNYFWTYDPEVLITEEGDKYLYYGSYYGGVEVRPLSANGLTTDPAQRTPIAIGNRYEGPIVFEREGFYYLFMSATNCCNGPLTHYGVFVARSESPTGPFIDREGTGILQGRVGGTPFLMQNGNRWIGTGHNDVFTDTAGQTWTIYHAVDQNDPYLEGAPGFTKRPALLDPVDWVEGWPVVRGGLGPSARPMPAPAAQEGQESSYTPTFFEEPTFGALMPQFSDEFTDTLGSQWSWVRPPAEDTYGFVVTDTATAFFFKTQAADLFQDSNNASVLTMDAPDGDYIVETRLRLDVPPEGCCFNYTQAGLVIRGDNDASPNFDDNFIKLVHFSLWETRQTEFAKEWDVVGSGYPRYGNGVIGEPGDWTWLRIVKQTISGADFYTGYSSKDGQQWERGGTWTHNLGPDAEIGLVSMGGAGFTAAFDYVRVYEIAPEIPTAVTLDTLEATNGGMAVVLLMALSGMVVVGAVAARRRLAR